MSSFGFSRVYGRMPEFPDRPLLYTEVEKPEPTPANLIRCAVCQYAFGIGEFSFRELSSREPRCRRCTRRKTAGESFQDDAE